LLTSPPDSAAERLADTFTKLRAFQIYDLGYAKCVFLDADMVVFRNPDQLFETKLIADDLIAANHACVCNLDNDHWAPAEWHKRQLCPYTPCGTTYEQSQGVLVAVSNSAQLSSLFAAGTFQAAASSTIVNTGSITGTDLYLGHNLTSEPNILIQFQTTSSTPTTTSLSASVSVDPSIVAGARAGIGIAGIILVFSLTGAIIWHLRRRRQRSQER